MQITIFKDGKMGEIFECKKIEISEGYWDVYLEFSGDSADPDSIRIFFSSVPQLDNFISTINREYETGKAEIKEKEKG